LERVECSQFSPFLMKSRNLVHVILITQLDGLLLNRIRLCIEPSFVAVYVYLCSGVVYNAFVIGKAMCDGVEYTS
jgi:hypothetical protein